MKAAQIKQAWIAWQESHQDEAAHIRSRFATKAIEHGFRKAQRYLMIAIMDKLHLTSFHDIEQALR
jgi:hypothetical protein